MNINKKYQQIPDGYWVIWLTDKNGHETDVCGRPTLKECIPLRDAWQERAEIEQWPESNRPWGGWSRMYIKGQ